MTRYVAIFVAAWMLAGCHAPVPSFDFLAPYGSPTVPSPRTGSIGTSGTYYAPITPGTQPAATAPVFAPPSQPLVPPSSYMGASDATSADETSNVSFASYQAGATHQIMPPATTVTDEPLPTGALAGAASKPSNSPSTLNLRGMPINDATESAELRAFSSAGEPTNISSLPVANGNSPSFLRFINPRTGTSGGTVTASPPTTTAPTGVWQTR